MCPDAGRHPILTNEFQRLANLVYLAFSNEPIGNLSLYIAGVRAASDGQFDALNGIILIAAIGNELNTPSFFAPIFVNDAAQSRIGEQRIYAALLGQSQGIENLLIRVVRLDQFGDID